MAKASDKVFIDFHGAEELEEAFLKLGGNMSARVITRALRKHTGEVRDAARANAPVKTRRLRRSIKSRIRNPGKYKGAFFVGRVAADPGMDRADTKGAFYAHFVESGTYKQDAQMFLEKALDSNAESYVQNIANTINGEIRKEISKAKGLKK